MRWGLRAQILTVPVVLTALAFGILGITSYRVVRHLMLQVEDRHTATLIQQAQELLDRSAKDLARQARQLADNLDLGEHLETRPYGHPIARDLLPWKIRWQVDWMDLIDRDGREIVSLAEGEDPISGFDKPPPMESAEAPLFRLGMSGINFSTVLRDEGKALLVGVSPVKAPSTGEVAGVLLLGRRLGARFLGEIAGVLGTRIALYGLDGTRLATSDEAFRPRCADCHAYIPPASGSEFHMRFIAARPPDRWATVGYRRLGMRLVSVQGEPLGLLVVEGDLSSTFRAFHRAMLGIVALGLLFAALGLAALDRAARWIVRPVRTLAEATRRRAEGDMSGRVPEEGAAEIQELARLFNQMTEQLAAFREAQEKLNRELEARVQERTRALEEAVDRLLTIRELGRDLPRAFSPKEILRSAARLGAQATAARAGCTVVRAGRGSPWTVAGVHGALSPRSEEVTFDPDLPLPDLAERGGAVLERQDGVSLVDPVSGEPVRSILVAAIRDREQEETSGLLLLYDPEGRPAFTQRDLDVIQPFAREVGAVLSAARFHEARQRAALEIVQSLVNAIEAKDTYTRGHTQRVTRLALALADRMGLDPERTAVLRQAAVLHDVGKIGVRQEVLNKPGSLDPVELDLVRQHPIIGARILEPLTFLKDVVEVVLQHHERPDGRGYPEGISGRDLRIESRILAAADAYDAMVSDRPYRKGRTPEEALREMREAAGTQFDPVVVEALEEIVRSGEGPDPAHPAEPGTG